MTLQTTGSISLQQIAQEFGDSPDHSISEFRQEGDGIPETGRISFSDFYGKRDTIEIDVNSDQADLNIYSYALANGWADGKNVKVTIGAGVNVYSTTPGAPAIKICDQSSQGFSLDTRINLINNGNIYGGPGAGGPGGANNVENGTVGSKGGTGVLVQPSGDDLTAIVVIQNNPTGYIYGGGGGGGGGGAGKDQFAWEASTLARGTINWSPPSSAYTTLTGNSTPQNCCAGIYPTSWTYQIQISTNTFPNGMGYGWKDSYGPGPDYRYLHLSNVLIAAETFSQWSIAASYPGSHVHYPYASPAAATAEGHQHGGTFQSAGWGTSFHPPDGTHMNNGGFHDSYVIVQDSSSPTGQYYYSPDAPQFSYACSSSNPNSPCSNLSDYHLTSYDVLRGANYSHTDGGAGGLGGHFNGTSVVAGAAGSVATTALAVPQQGGNGGTGGNIGVTQGGTGVDGGGTGSGSVTAGLAAVGGEYGHYYQKNCVIGLGGSFQFLNFGNVSGTFA